MAKLSTETKKTLKNIGLVAIGGIVEWAVESASDMYVTGQQDIFPGYNTGDAIGAAEAVILTVVGLYTKKEKVALVGAGGLAVAVPNLIVKGLRQAGVTIPAQSFSTNSTLNYGGQGRYNRHVALAPATYVPPAYRRR